MRKPVYAICHRSIVWLGSSVVRVLARYAEVLGLSPVRAMCFFIPCDIWWQVWACPRAASNKGTVSSVPAWFRADSETNLIKQGESVTGRPCGSVTQRTECSHGMREVLGSSPGRAMCFYPRPPTPSLTHIRTTKGQIISFI